MFSPVKSRIALLFVATAPGLLLAGCNRYRFPSYGDNQREYAYVTSGTSNTVAVLDLIYLRQDRVIAVGRNPTGLALNPVNNEVYAVNTDSDTVSVIDAAQGKVTVTIGVHAKPYFIDVAADGKRAYVANSGVNTVSILDLVHHREMATAATGEVPVMAKITPDMRSVVVANRGSGSISIYDVTHDGANPLRFRTAFPGCPGANDIAILADSTKAFIACSSAKKVMSVWLAAAPDSWNGKQDASLQHDHLLAILDVGATPAHLALKSDGGDLFVMNYDSDTVSDISTWTNEVVGTYPVGSKPAHAILTHDNGTLWISNFGGDSAGFYSTDDAKVEGSVRAGSGPDALALSADEHLLLVANARSGDVAVIRTQSKSGPELVTMLPAGGHPNDIVVKAFSVK